MLEKEKVLAELRISAKQYGLSADVLESFASSAQVEDEEALKTWIESQRPIFAVMQKSLDTARSKRTSEEKDQPGGDELDKKIEAAIAAITAKYEQKISALETKVAENETKATQVEFQEKVKRIGSEVGLKEDVLTILSASLKDSMTDEEIKNSLSASKATLVKAGLPVEETVHRKATNEEQLRKEAGDWVEQQIKKQKPE